jgi:gliding motility-associated-like protein
MKQHYYQILLISVFLFLIGNQLSAQCPDLTNATLDGIDCINGTTACDVCAGDVISLNVEGTDLPDGGTIDWFYSDSPGFNPYNGQGTFMGSADISTTSNDPPCTNCPELLAIMVDACGSEDNEFMVVWSGSGFDVNSFTLDYDSNNNFGVPQNDDVNLGGSCTWANPDPGLITGTGCGNVVAAGPGTSIPANAPVIVFPSSGANATFDFSSLCITGITIYVMQSSCNRDAGAFTNGSSSANNLRTTTIGLNNCPCTDAITYDRNQMQPPADGDFVVSIPLPPPFDLQYGNFGCTFPMGVIFPPNVGGTMSTVDQFDFTVPTAMCNGGPYYVTGIINPAPMAPCNQELTQELTFNVLCPIANPIMTQACFNPTIANFIDLTQFESAINGGSGLPVNWFNDAAGLNPVSPPLSNALIDPNEPNFYVTIGSGSCVSEIEVFIITLVMGPDLGNFMFELDPTESCGPANVSVIFMYPGGGVYDVVLDVAGSNWQQMVVSGAPFLLGNFNQTTDVTLLSVDDGSCPVTFSPAPVETFTIETPPNAAPFSMEMCEDENGEATFDLTSIDDDVNLNSGEPVNWFEENMGNTPINTSSNYTINNTTTIFANVGTAPCFSQFVSIDLTINDAPEALPETLDACDDGNGFADFDLTSLDNDVNNGSGNTVTWYETQDLNDPIVGPQNYNSNGGSVYAVVDDGQCSSGFVEITLTVIAGGTPNLGIVTLCETDMLYNLTPLEDTNFSIGMWTGNGVSGDFFDPAGQSPDVVLTFIPTGDCVQDGMTIITVNAAQIPVLGTETICDVDGIYDLSNLVDAAFPIGTWSGNGVQADGVTFDPAGQVSPVTLTFQSDTDCTNAETTTLIIENATPVILATGETCEDDGLFDLNTLLPAGSTTGTWSGTGVEADGFNFNPIGLSGSNTVTFTPNEGCVIGGTTTVFVAADVVTNITETFCSGSGNSVMSGMDVYDEMTPMGTTTLTTEFGCDSIINVNLIFETPVDGTYENILCPGSAEIIGGIEFNEMMPSGPAILQTPNGCDSIVMVTLTFENEVTNNITETFCSGSGAEVIVGMDVYDEMMPMGMTMLTTPSGCDSTVIVNLTYENPMDGNYTNTICAGQTETVGGVVFTQLMPFGTVTLQSPNGCDSMVMVIINFAAQVTNNINETYCTGSGEEVTVGMDIYNEMMPMGTTTLQTPSGCDSIVNVNLTFENPMDGTYENTFCSGQSEIIGGIEFNEMMPSGPAILQTPKGCDSTVMVTLTFEDEITENINETFCSGSGEEVVVGMDTYNEATPMGMTTLITPSGCDSTVTVNLTYENPMAGTYENTLCPGSSEIIGGIEFNEMMPSGPAILQTPNGCDSTVLVTLTFQNEVTENINETYCSGSGEEVVVGMDVYNEMMPMGTTMLTTPSGCDSIVNVNLTFETPMAGTYENMLCTGQSEIVGGIEFNEMMPIGPAILQTANGCDSTVMVTLTFSNEVTENITQIFCYGSGAEVIVGMDVYNEMMPMGTTMLTTPSGCDSIVNVDLTFNNEVTENVAETFCAGSGDEIIVGFDIYNEMMPTGTTILQNVDGCDSIVTVVLTYETPTPGTYENMLCTGGSETIGGTVFDETMPSGTAIFQSVNGCDSIVMVTITFVNEVVANIAERLCPGESITIDGVTYDENLTMGSTTLPMGSFFGCDSTINVSIDFHPEAVFDFTATLNIDETVDIGGVTFSATNSSGTVILPMASVNGCDSTINVNLQFTQEYIIEQFSSAPLCPNENTGSITIDTIETFNLPVFITLNGVPQGTFVAFPIDLTDLFAGFYDMSIFGNSGIEITSEIQVSPAAPLTLNLGADQTIQLGDAIELSGQTTVNDATWQWEPPLYLSCDTCLKTVAIPLEQITYELTGINANGCSVSDNITLFIQRSTPVFAPNIFSPNNDGVNDFFYIHATSEVASIRNFQIFDRWGGQVFNRAELLPNDPLMGWNGLHKGKVVEFGVYVFFVEVELVDGQKEMLKGGVTVIR